ncbi:MAG TPA: hypothetical protein VN132_08815 [Bdellovibrio sp.]|nr:hypothetical protein [Bdellovibrio sp.]
MEQTSETKSLLIIKSQPQTLGPAEGFLRNREWSLKATANLKEALVHLVQSQPKFVMISIDHPNRKVKALPKVLTQAFPVCVIIYCDNPTAANVKILNDMGCEYVIFPPVTGPAIERMVNKYYKDMQTRGQTPHTRNSMNEKSGAEDGGMISIKGEGGTGNDSAHNFLAQFLGGETGDAAIAGNSSSANASILSASGMNSFENSSTADLAQALKGAMAGQADSGKDYAANLERPMGTPGHNSGEANPLESAKNLNPASNSSQANGVSTKGMSSSKENSFSRSGKKSPPTWGPLDAPVKNSATEKERTKKPRPPMKDEDSLISKGAKEALENSTTQTPPPPLVELRQISNFSCIIVESPRFSGYLIAAMGKNNLMDKNFIETIRKRLMNFLRANGELAEDRPSMPIKVREVPFEDWALEHADFLRKSIHNGEEIGMAFFPRANAKMQIHESADGDMAAISVKDLAPDATVEFNLYIHLPRNNKYLLYTPSGGVFLGQQKERLTSQGVSHLHVLKLEMEDLDKYHAQNFLNDLITEFESKEKKSAA